MVKTVEERVKRLAGKYRVVMVEPLYPLNVGYVLRTMKNFGLEELYLVNPRLDLESRELRAFSAHAQDMVKQIRVVRELKEALKGVNYIVGTTGKGGGRYNVNRIPLSPSEFASNVSRLRGKVAILLGREDIGLTNEELLLCDALITIPANPAYPILNVSHAAAIIFYELFKTEISPSSRRIHEPPRPEELRVFEKYLLELLREIKYPDCKVKIARIIVRRVLGRAFVTRREMYALLGILRKTLNRIKVP